MRCMKLMVFGVEACTGVYFLSHHRPAFAMLPPPRVVPATLTPAPPRAQSQYNNTVNSASDELASCEAGKPRVSLWNLTQLSDALDSTQGGCKCRPWTTVHAGLWLQSAEFALCLHSADGRATWMERVWESTCLCFASASVHTVFQSLPPTAGPRALLDPVPPPLEPMQASSLVTNWECPAGAMITVYLEKTVCFL